MDTFPHYMCAHTNSSTNSHRVRETSRVSYAIHCSICIRILVAKIVFFLVFYRAHTQQKIEPAKGRVGGRRGFFLLFREIRNRTKLVFMPKMHKRTKVEIIGNRYSEWNMLHILFCCSSLMINCFWVLFICSGNRFECISFFFSVGNVLEDVEREREKCIFFRFPMR